MSEATTVTECVTARAPLCFGAITFFSMDSEHCGACPCTSECAELVKKHIAKVSHIIDVDSLLTKHMALKKSKKQLPPVIEPDSGKLETQDPEARLKRETMAAIERLKASAGGIRKFRARFALGENTAEANTPEAIAIDLLLKGPLTRGDLRVALAETVDDASLSSDALFAALVGMNVAVVMDEQTIKAK